MRSQRHRHFDRKNHSLRRFILLVVLQRGEARRTTSHQVASNSLTERPCSLHPGTMMESPVLRGTHEIRSSTPAAPAPILYPP
ncbi:hypothetical protein BC834DRAFT_357555 [Gloeopeniophorella convolvens]|nr:hypothetical protein BC834DRAFT_357555 [Gloeopeniophorella convolvens]